MSKKTLNILLLIVVLSVWGGVIYKSLLPYFKSNDVSIQTSPKITTVPLSIASKDTFALVIQHRDPFLGTLAPSSNKLVISTPIKPKYSKANETNSKKNKIVAPPIELPSVTYLGYVKDLSNNQHEVVLLKINEQVLRLKKGVATNGYIVTQIYKDSVYYQFQKKRYTAYKQTGAY